MKTLKCSTKILRWIELLQKITRMFSMIMNKIINNSCTLDTLQTLAFAPVKRRYLIFITLLHCVPRLLYNVYVL